MKINNIGYNYIHPDGFTIDREHGTGDRMLLIIKSHAFVMINGECCHVAPNTVMLFSKNLPQYYGACGEEFINDWFHFDTDEADEKELESLGIPSDIPINVNDATVLSELIRHMYFEAISANPKRTETVSLYLRLFFIKLSEKIMQKNGDSSGLYSDMLANLRAEIYNTPSKNWTVDKMASRISISRSRFQHLYKQFFGVGAKTDVILARIEYAKYLLGHTSYTVCEVASLCGYQNDVHFMRQFKKHSGVTPSNYRNR